MKKYLNLLLVLILLLTGCSQNNNEQADSLTDEVDSSDSLDQEADTSIDESEEEVSLVGIWVSEDWVNPSASSSINTTFTQTLVLMEDGTGVMAAYVSENGANFEEYPRTFYDGLTWSENGTMYSTWIILESILGNCSYKNDDENLFIIYYPDYDMYYYQCKYLFEIIDGKLYRYNSDEEYVIYNKVSYFEEPYVGSWFGPSNLQTMNSMDYSNPKEVYDELRRVQDIYWDGSTYRNGLGTTFTKNGNIYSRNRH